MATAYQAVSGEVSIGRVFSRAFGFIGRNPALALVTAFLFSALPVGLGQLLNFGAIQPGLSRPMAAGLGTLQLLSFLLIAVFNALSQATMTRALVVEHEGRGPSLGESLSAGLRYALPVVGFTILWYIGIFLGTLLLIVPGLILLTMWAVAVSALVEERTGVIGAFGRSRELTKGSRWKVFGLLAAILVVFYLSLALVGFAARLTGSPGQFTQRLPLLMFVWSVVSTGIFNLLWSTIQPSLFIELRDAREGGGAGELHQVFA
ncbi:hypothetical protein HMF7854_07075 [Sphingomonas ginkgonis]|uniref:Glycerophosphoryl diester phosphodiesterase membrane domain-containing protein n=1 Tax=Sphingomonas ginkgonis TaxID=2315330 RepID=A0A429V9F8_9SPHN|nr:hypothetical protein [Sphingomonas ginkgonis]RST30623.1 hypothetical protein HMF7854_07075 [Sphingomonas ginkgonis]